MQIITREAGSSIYKTAALTVAALVAFFFLIKAAGWVHIVELRLLNLVILLFAIRHVLRMERKLDHNHLEYLTGLMHGVFTALLVSIGFAAFIFFYLSYVDHALMQAIRHSQPFGEFLNPLSASLIVFLEGLTSGAVLSFVLMRIMKRETQADL